MISFPYFMAFLLLVLVLLYLGFLLHGLIFVHIFHFFLSFMTIFSSCHFLLILYVAFFTSLRGVFFFALQYILTSYVLYTVSTVYMCQSESHNSTPSTPCFPLGILMFVFYLCVSINFSLSFKVCLLFTFYFFMVFMCSVY